MADPVELANTIPALEQGITGRLRTRVSAVAVDPYPGDPLTYRLMHPVGALLVCYQGGDYGDPAGLGVVAQDRTLAFVVFVVARELTGHAGAYVWLEAARLALTGYEVPGFAPLIPRRERYVGQKDGVWVYGFTVSAETEAVQETDEEAGALLRRLTLASNYTTTEIVSQ